MENDTGVTEWMERIIQERGSFSVPDCIRPLYAAAVNAYGLLGEIAGEIGEFREGSEPLVDALMALGVVERTTAVAMDELADALGVVSE